MCKITYLKFLFGNSKSLPSEVRFSRGRFPWGFAVCRIILITPAGGSKSIRIHKTSTSCSKILCRTLHRILRRILCRILRRILHRILRKILRWVLCRILCRILHRILCWILRRMLCRILCSTSTSCSEILCRILHQGLLENGQDTDRQNFYFLYLTENENLSLKSRFCYTSPTESQAQIMITF